MSSTRPVIEIAGVWLPNKGAELMAHATIAALRKRLPDAQFRSPQQGPDAMRAEIGMPAMPQNRGQLWRLVPFAGERLAFRAKRPEITHVIDISGFAYGDHWGAKKARRRVGAYLRAGYPTYVMPQAFGPFTDPTLADEMRFILPRLGMVAARDAVSLDHLQKLNAGVDIPKMPDITLGLDISARDVTKPAGPYGCVVVNAQLMKAGALDEDGINALFGGVITAMKNASVTPVVVLHEPRADAALSQTLADAHGVQMIALDDARDIKAFIAGSTCTVTARFHGLANALSTGVPAFAVSWSHKYKELLSDFGCADAIFDGDTDAFLSTLRHFLNDDAAQAQRRAALQAKVAQIKPQLETWWDTLADKIQASG
ncbi:Polysaccharide pyruvyl transferase family protein WcaK [Cognatiyoonia koreensis]|uniref:Polysaccharide pyruvyl transferase family protein WcaK n=1 Tax=Cognatiyoonia koreensis TaxID=364200 RepID=A0A1I0QMS7_9RHOB|nr:polysaccharide pyruvyl transferase family protein [Cognatiyoonia koreensis]SEW28521.1 Polysaccharide pyruvyl transferase family protein WcaK [Cognatiyoonia koreensis]